MSSTRSTRARSQRASGADPEARVPRLARRGRDLAEPDHALARRRFLPEQPDLNWWNEGVRDAFDEILRFWFGRGVAGFRIDVPYLVVKDRDLRDNPPLEEGDPWWLQGHGQRLRWNYMRPELHEVLRRWRAVADAEDPPRLLVGEGVIDPADVARFYGAGDDELHMTFNLGLSYTPFEARALRDVVESAERLLPSSGWPLWTLGNHDIPRYGSRWAGGDGRKVRAALQILFGLRGTPTLYYGDELGLGDAEVAPDAAPPVGRPARRRLLGALGSGRGLGLAARQVDDSRRQPDRRGADRRGAPAGPLGGRRRQSVKTRADQEEQGQNQQGLIAAVSTRPRPRRRGRRSRRSASCSPRPSPRRSPRGDRPARTASRPGRARPGARPRRRLPG